MPRLRRDIKDAAPFLAHHIVVWTATKSFYCSGVNPQNLIGRSRLSLRIVIWPTPALLTRTSIVPKRLRAPRTSSSIASSRAKIGLYRLSYRVAAGAVAAAPRFLPSHVPPPPRLPSHPPRR